ncbi:prolipoprotein diacylglyceryl transferase [Curtanaerobium respiraculi]|uniref:prolipoprotein diacylglyceryl transferase n=1 Tax=Curtanaerobium respiraculi TaxID=2949669 RepID=UPI0024B363CC|nr:prolipoprotein diacylglyceryl transferase [Curtanaerobium respiraculi]
MLNSIYHAIDPVALSLGPLTVRWYGIAYILGFSFAALIVWKTAKRWRINLDEDALLTIIICVIVGVILGARLGYVVFYGDGYYLNHPWDIFAFSQGGMSFHGGLAGALVSGCVAARLCHVPFATLADLGAIAAPVGLFFGRCANFINGELWGAPTDLPWGVVFGGAAGSVARHPSQLYEALLEGALIFIVMLALSRRVPARPRGTFIGAFLVLYGICRFSIEFVRLPDSQLGYLLGTDWLTMGQVLSVPLVLAGICVIAWARRAKLPQQGAPMEGGPAPGAPREG